MVALQSLFSAKTLQCSFAPEFAHSGCGLLFLGCFRAAVRAVDSAPIDWKRFPTALASSCGQRLQGCFQFGIVGQNCFPKVPAHGAIRVADTQHGALAVQRQTAVLSVIVCTVSSHQFSDGASFLCCQFSCGFCHRHIFPFLNFWEYEKVPAGLGGHLTSSLWLWGNFQKPG